MISYNEKHFTKDGKAWFPVMGEYEFSRTDRADWEKGLAKMKALGINTVQTYVIWLHHEELKGHFNFRENNNLRAFIRLVKDAGMKMCLRVGPWVHAELRSGGFPDWIYEQGYVPRTNDARYLADVRAYFEQIYKQCEGYFECEGGPIFSIQVENEFRRHTAGNAEEGNRHINLLIEMLSDIGFKAEIYFATAWGNAVVGKAMPTWGEYAAQPWEQHADPLPLNSAYLIGNNPNEVPVGEYTERPVALGKNDGATASVPYMTIEQGSGNQPTKLRRPIVTAEDNGAMVFCRLAQGLSGIGYYVFHGGINPHGALSTTQEYVSEEYKFTRAGYFCDLAEKNYDFQGAVSMYNRITDNGRELKLWNSFASEFSDVLCNADVTLGEKNATDPEDLISHRYSVRKNGDSGFLFFNNYVRHGKTESKTIKNFVFATENERIALPDTVVGGKDYAAFPFNLRFGDSLLKYADATPLYRLDDAIVLFNGGGKAKYEKSGNGKVIVLNKNEAKNSFKVRIAGRDYLFLTESEIYSVDGQLYFEYASRPKVKVYPKPKRLFGFEFLGQEGDFAVYEADDERSSVGVCVGESYKNGEYTEYTVKLSYGEKKPYDAYLSFDFEGDLAEIYIDGEKVNDAFYIGVPFEVSMRYHSFPKEITFRIYPLEKEREIYLERIPKYENGVACRLNGVSVESVVTIKMEMEIE